MLECVFGLEQMLNDPSRFDDERDDGDYEYQEECKSRDDDESTMEVEENSGKHKAKMVEWTECFCYYCHEKLDRPYLEGGLVEDDKSAEEYLRSRVIASRAAAFASESSQEGEEKFDSDDDDDDDFLVSICVHLSGYYLPVCCLKCMEISPACHGPNMYSYSYDFECPGCIIGSQRWVDSKMGKQAKLRTTRNSTRGRNIVVQ
jgi:hypothetical protein